MKWLNHIIAFTIFVILFMMITRGVLDSCIATSRRSLSSKKKKQRHRKKKKKKKKLHLGGTCSIITTWTRDCIQYQGDDIDF